MRLRLGNGDCLYAIGRVRAWDFEAAEDHLGHALTDFYRLYERAKQPPSSPAARKAALEATDEGRTALAIAWARNFHTHDVVEVSETANIYSGYYTRLYGVLAWRPRSSFTTNPDGEGRHKERILNEQMFRCRNWPAYAGLSAILGPISLQVVDGI